MPCSAPPRERFPASLEPSFSKNLPLALLAACATLACMSQLPSLLLNWNPPSHWYLSPSGAVATLLACAAMLTLRVRDPLGAIILPGIVATFGTVNVILGLLPESASPDATKASPFMPVLPSALLLLMSIGCLQHSTNLKRRRLAKTVAGGAMLSGLLILIAYATPGSFALQPVLTSQATLTGAILITGLGGALWLLGDAAPARYWRAGRSNQNASMAINSQGRITQVNSAKAHFLGSQRHTLIGKEFGQVFNDQTMSATDLGKLRRAYSWAQTGKVPVATVITYQARSRSPYLLDTLVQPTLVDGQVSGVHLCAKDISGSPDFHTRH